MFDEELGLPPPPRVGSARAGTVFSPPPTTKGNGGIKHPSSLLRVGGCEKIGSYLAPLTLGGGGEVPILHQT